jgi:outer membrane protein OmpA-like peptidoglycan-associated protein/opacity protein-like surface antigen
MALVALGLGWSAGAVAQSKGIYVSGGISAALPRDATIVTNASSTEVEFVPGLSYSIAIGSTLGGNWRAEAELMHRTADIDEISGATNGGGTVTGDALLINGYRDFNIDARLTPYIGAGIGIIRVGFEDVSPIDNSRIDDNDWVAAAQVIAGIGFRINDYIGLFGDYRFFAAAKQDFTAESGATVEGEYREHRLTFGLRWSFSGPAPREDPVRTSAAAQAKRAMAASGKGPVNTAAMTRRALPVTPSRIAAPASPPIAAAAARAPSPLKEPAVVRRFVLFFDWDRATLNDEARATVRDAARASTQLSVTVVQAVGHADRSGPKRYNLSLSRRRAEAVKAELVRLGIHDKDIVIMHRGESDPLVATTDGKREHRNRRVEITLK